MKGISHVKGTSRAKKVFACAFALFCLLLFFGLFRPPVRAQAESAEKEAMEELGEHIDTLLSALDAKELQNYLDKLSEFRGVSLKDSLKAMITGDYRLDYASLGEAVLGLLWDEAALLLPAFAVILAVSLLCGILNSAKSGFLHSTMSDIIGFVGYLAVGAVVLACLTSAIAQCFETVESMRTQMELVYPILLTLMAASGGTVSAAVYRPAVAFMSGGICKLFEGVVLPVAVVTVVLSFVGNLSDGVKTEKLGDFFKSISKWLIGLCLGLFSLFLTVQGISSAQYDGLSLRAVKYVVSGSVPVVGGFLSGGMDLIIAGSALIKNALGAFAVFLLVGTIAKPLLLFGVLQLFLRLSAAVTEPVGGKIPTLLSRLAGDLGYFVAGMLCVAFLYFLTLLLLVCSSGVIL